MLRRISTDQPNSFQFSKENLLWAKKQLKKYPKGRQASAVIPLLWRAQEQEGWVSKPAIEFIADFLGMAPVRVLEVASFYFMFHLKPVGSQAHFQVCGTTPCMLRGSEELLKVCKKRISETPLTVSENGAFSWEEVECLGGCANAPVVQIGKDYYEDLDQISFNDLIDKIDDGKSINPGSFINRFSSEPASKTKKLSKVKFSNENASVEKFEG